MVVAAAAADEHRDGEAKSKLEATKDAAQEAQKIADEEERKEREEQERLERLEAERAEAERAALDAGADAETETAADVNVDGSGAHVDRQVVQSVDTESEAAGGRGLAAEHPDQRRQVVEDRSLIPRVIDETLRYEPTGHAVARYVAEDVEYHGTTVPAGSAMLLLVASANRDERRYANPDVYDIHRPDIAHLTFGYGLHFCLGANLARLEGRVALDELLNRWPEWDIDESGMRLASTSTVRGWESMPLVLP